ncbi:MAG: sugar phosphate isomerase/epimerase [Anaerolineae bacterium]|nr:sugar phosphate isomerase/epimerase [Anaerolineae bacterium]
MNRIPIALQLYSVRQDCEADLPGTLKAVAEMGYDGVDFAGYYGYKAVDIHHILDDLGLKVAGCHTGLATLTGDSLQTTIEYNQILGNRFLIVPWIPEEQRISRDAWLRTADVFNNIAAILEPEAMYTGYHNHHIEFTPLDGEAPWDIFYGHTTERVIHQIDTGNALHGGGNPTHSIARYPGRSMTVHLKEYSATNDEALIGEGETDWATIFRLCETIGGTEWYIVEQESYPYPPLECARRCLTALKTMGK